jgi:pimeloyl-ACP methyl ester carboxylesterase
VLISSIALNFAFVILNFHKDLKRMLKYLDIGSVKIACLISEGDSGVHKRSLIFIHGSGGDHTAWLNQYAQLKNKYKLVAVDLPGHGRSEGSGEKHIKDYCVWIKNLLEVLELNDPILIGHSLGAAIALQFAVDHPGEISGIVCLGGGMKMPVNPFFLDFLKTNPTQMPAEITELICKYSLAKENRSRLSAVLQKSISQSKVDILYGDLSACNELDLTGEAEKIKVPVLIICGAGDKMTPPDLSRELAAKIKGAGLEIIAGAGHMVMIERPEEFNIFLDRFVTSVSQGISQKR